MRTRHLLLPLTAALLAGCARTPSGVSNAGSALITFQVKFNGSVNNGAYYFIVMDTDPNGKGGPVVVTGPPWGNGYAAGSYTHFVEYNGGSFTVSELPVNTDHTQTTPHGNPLEAGIASTDGPNDTLQVTLNVSQITDLHPNARAIRVNFITASRLPLASDDPGGDRATDGLGGSGNDYVTIPLDQTNTYVNGAAPFGTETINDALNLAANPGLDIKDWRITVQTSG